MVRARQIPEWDVYDQEIARFTERVSGDSGLAISVDALAGEKVEGGKKQSEAQATGLEQGIESREEDHGRIEDEL